MEEEKFSPVGGGSSSEEPKGFKVKVITILIVLLVIVLAIVAISSIKKNRERALNESLAIAQVTYELNRIKIGDELALEKYLNYSSLLDNSEDIEEDVIEDEEVEEKDEDKDITEEKSKTEVSKDEKAETSEEVTKDDIDKEEEKNAVSEEDEDAEVEETDVTEDNDNIIKQLLSTFSFEVKDAQIEGDNSTVEVAITNKNSGEIFNKYFTRAIKLTINNTLSTKKTDDGKIAKELNEYLEEQMVSEEIPTVTNNVKFFLKKDSNNDWKVESVEKDLTNLVLPDFIETLNNLAETYGEYGD